MSVGLNQGKVRQFSDKDTGTLQAAPGSLFLQIVLKPPRKRLPGPASTCGLRDELG